MLNKVSIARWESRRGKYWVELFHDELGFTYRTESGGGNLGGKIAESDAISHCALQASYAPVKTMKRTK
jgi:hypothetical protein